jgi:hypothetical protein
VSDKEAAVHGTLARRRFWLECALALVSATLTLGTVFVHDWIEVLFGIDPDAGGGQLEAAATIVATAVTVLLVLAARREWLRTTRPSSVRR